MVVIVFCEEMGLSELSKKSKKRENEGYGALNSILGAFRGGCWGWVWVLEGQKVKTRSRESITMVY